MLCMLMGEKNCNLFGREWVPYMYVVVEHGRILNWANILADVLQKVLRRYLEAPEGAKPSFFYVCIPSRHGLRNDRVSRVKVKVRS